MDTLIGHEAKTLKNKLDNRLTNLEAVLEDKRDLVVNCAEKVRIAKRRISVIGKYIKQARIYESLQKIKLGKGLKSPKMVSKIRNQISEQLIGAENKLEILKSGMKSHNELEAYKAKLAWRNQNREILRMKTIKRVLKNPRRVVAKAKKLILKNQKAVLIKKKEKKELKSEIVRIQMIILRNQIVREKLGVKLKLSTKQKAKLKISKKRLEKYNKKLASKKISLRSAKHELKSAKKTVTQQFNVLKITKGIKKSAVKDIKGFKKLSKKKCEK